MNETILTETDGHILRITLNRPEKMNAISVELSEALMEALETFDRSPDLRVAILTGAGRAFCAGRDLKQRAGEQAAPPTVGRELSGYLASRPEDRHSTWSTNKPLIAAVNGFCLGGGFELALGCDIRIAADHAKFGLPEITRGFFPGGGGPQRLAKIAPQSLAMEMLLTGDPIDATTAFQTGIVSRVVPAADLLPTATGLAEKIAANAPIAVRAVKEVYTYSVDAPLAEAHRFGNALRWMVGQTDDAKEGPRAFSEGRTPVYRGE
jgi:enoyl-CoA hydratase/carnithine racemase